METTLAWERARAHSLTYSRRDPTQQLLYRIVYNYHQELEHCWSERFEHTHGCFRREMKQALNDFLDCGILLHGCACAVCEQCGHAELIPFSCKQKFLCPSCDAKRALLFGEHLHKNILLPHPHVHQVWSIPKILRPRFKFNRSLFQLLFNAAWESWKELIEDALPGCTPAGVMSLHSSGDLLHWHPHLHGIALYGGVDRKGNVQLLASVNTEYLTNCFSRNLLDALLKAGEIDQELIDLIRSWEHSGFHAYIGDPIKADDTQGRLFVSRYLKKSAISESRLELIEDSSSPVVRIHKNTDDGSSHRDFDPLEFLANLVINVPGFREQTVRYLGKYSARSRGAKRLALDTPGPLPVTEPPRRPSADWARCMAQVFEFEIGAPFDVSALLRLEVQVGHHLLRHSPK